MKKQLRTSFFLLPFLFLAIFQPSPSPRPPAHAEGGAAALGVLDRNGQPISHLTDGDTISLRLELPQAAGQATPVTFYLNGVEKAVAQCNILQGKISCQSEPFAALGWYWSPDRQSMASRSLTAKAAGEILASSSPLAIAPRPVVMVHGFSSDWKAWVNYLGPQGYLASVGIPAYAVGDGQMPGVLNTGLIAQPTARTNTIAENAAVLQEYIQEVLKSTGAQKVDLIAHSMGGLISRYYIDRLVKDEVAQLIMLGSPMAGTACANLPASLNFYLPAALEIQPMYVVGIFNPQITHRKNVGFYALAGVPIREAVGSPCTPVPTDLAVSLESVGAIPLHISQTPVLHTELNLSEQVFREYVLPVLQTPAGSFPEQEPDPAVAGGSLKSLQFSRIETGHLDPGQFREVVVNLDPGISVASFALYDSSRSLDTVVRGASGRIIQLDPQANGLVRVEDPSTMLYLGYGFNNPKPGAWKITLQTTDSTPAGGSDYAITALFQGGAQLQVQASLLLPKQNEPVRITAGLSLDGEALAIEAARASVRLPDGASEEIPLTTSSGQVSGTWIARQPGLSYIQLAVSGRTSDDFPIDRSATLVVETQPGRERTMSSLTLLIGIVGLTCAGGLALLGFVIYLFRRRR